MRPGRPFACPARLHTKPKRNCPVAARYVTFNPIRSIGIPFTTYIKPGHMYRAVSEIVPARQILFPEYWQVNALIYALKKKYSPVRPPITWGMTRLKSQEP